MVSSASASVSAGSGTDGGWRVSSYIGKTGEKTQQAVVEAVGPGTEKEKITVKPGEKILYDKYAGTGIKIDGEDYLILKNCDIIAVVE